MIAREQGRGKWGVRGQRGGASVGDGEKVLELDSGGVVIALNATELFMMLNFM